MLVQKGSIVIALILGTLACKSRHQSSETQSAGRRFQKTTQIEINTKPLSEYEIRNIENIKTLMAQTALTKEQIARIEGTASLSCDPIPGSKFSQFFYKGNRKAAPLQEQDVVKGYDQEFVKAFAPFPTMLACQKSLLSMRDQTVCIGQKTGYVLFDLAKMLFRVNDGVFPNLNECARSLHSNPADIYDERLQFVCAPMARGGLGIHFVGPLNPLSTKSVPIGSGSFANEADCVKAEANQGGWTNEPKGADPDYRVICAAHEKGFATFVFNTTKVHPYAENLRQEGMEWPDLDSCLLASLSSANGKLCVKQKSGDVVVGDIFTLKLESAAHKDVKECIEQTFYR